MIAANRTSLARVQRGVNIREGERTLLIGAALMAIWLGAAVLTLVGGGPYELLLVHAIGAMTTARFVSPCLTRDCTGQCVEARVEESARTKRAA